MWFCIVYLGFLMFMKILDVTKLLDLEPPWRPALEGMGYPVQIKFYFILLYDDNGTVEDLSGSGSDRVEQMPCGKT